MVNIGMVTIQKHTTKNPITMIGEEAGICWGTDITNNEKNYKRGIDCLQSEHGRTFEFPDVYMILDGYSARVIREWYTHIGGAPTRLQASTRYINYKKFDYIVPPTILKNNKAEHEYTALMGYISKIAQRLEDLKIPREDIANILPLGMTTRIVDKRNLRNLIDMSHQRLCTRAYHEYRKLFNDICNALKDYSEEWAYIVDNYFKPKCKYMGFCKEKYSCGMMPKQEDNN